MDQKQLVIERPNLVKWPERLTATGVTLFFWAAFLYMLQPLVSLIAWMLNIGLFQQQMLVLGGLQGFLNEAGFHLQIYSVFCGCLLIWAKVNELRFKNVERRRHVGSTDRQRMGETFGIDGEELYYWLDQRRIDCDIDSETGRLVSIRTSDG